MAMMRDKKKARCNINNTCPEVPAAELEIVCLDPLNPLDHNSTLPKTEGFATCFKNNPPNLRLPCMWRSRTSKAPRAWTRWKAFWWLGWCSYYPSLKLTQHLKMDGSKLEDYFPFWEGLFSSAMLVSGRVTMLQWGHLLILIPLANSHVQTSIGLEVMIDAINHEKRYKTIMNLSNIYKQFLWTNLDTWNYIIPFLIGCCCCCCGCCCCCCCCCQLFKLILALRLHSSQGLPLANNSSVEYLHLQSSTICILLKHVHIHNAISHWDILSTLFGHIWNVSLYL